MDKVIKNDFLKPKMSLKFQQENRHGRGKAVARQLDVTLSYQVGTHQQNPVIDAWHLKHTCAPAGEFCSLCQHPTHVLVTKLWKMNTGELNAQQQYM